MGGLAGLEAGGVYGDDAVAVILAGLGRRVGVGHFLERLGGGVAVLEALEDGASKRVLGGLGNGGEGLAVPLDEEVGEAAFEVGRRVPCDEVAVDPDVRGRRRRGEVRDGCILDVLHPGLSDALAWEPEGLLFVACKPLYGNGFTAEKRG